MGCLEGGLGASEVWGWAEPIEGLGAWRERGLASERVHVCFKFFKIPSISKHGKLSKQDHKNCGVFLNSYTQQISTFNIQANKAIELFTR